MIIDHTYFTGMLSVGITITGASDTTNSAELERLNSYIDYYEREYLESILGMDLCGDFISYVDNRTDESEKEQRWEDILCKLTEKVNPIACYVFFKLIGECNYQVTRNGVIGTADDDAVSPRRLQIRAWNDMVRLNIHIYRILENGGYDGVQSDPYMFRTINDLGL